MLDTLSESQIHKINHTTNSSRIQIEVQAFIGSPHKTGYCGHEQCQNTFEEFVISPVKLNTYHDD